MLTLVDRWSTIIQLGGPMLSKVSLIVLLIGIASATIFFITTPKKNPVEPLSKEEWAQFHKIPIVAKTFMNERTLLDGYSYSNCTFINPRLIYNATAPFDLLNCTFKGTLLIGSDKPQIEGFIFALKELQFMRPDLQVIKPDK